MLRVRERCHGDISQSVWVNMLAPVTLIKDLVPERVCLWFPFLPNSAWLDRHRFVRSLVKFTLLQKQWFDWLCCCDPNKHSESKEASAGNTRNYCHQSQTNLAHYLHICNAFINIQCRVHNFRVVVVEAVVPSNGIQIRMGFCKFGKGAKCCRFCQVGEVSRKAMNVELIVEKKTNKKNLFD